MNNYCEGCFVPFQKMSKRKRMEMNKKKRAEWGFNPTTRVKQSKKVYNRKKVHYYED